MTMLNMLCDVCRTGRAIGVASTSVPYSVAYCERCAREGADPIEVTDYHFEIVNGDLTAITPSIHDKIATYYQGRYITFREFFAGRLVGAIVPGD